MPKYMIVHEKNTEFVSSHVNHYCKICAKEKNADWKRVSYSLNEGKIFCLWEAPDRETLVKSLDKCNLITEEIIEVEEMYPDECDWEVFGELEE